MATIRQLSQVQLNQSLVGGQDYFAVDAAYIPSDFWRFVAPLLIVLLNDSGSIRDILQFNLHAGCSRLNLGIPSIIQFRFGAWSFFS